jgi:rhodanese-related sulfurtransferase
MKTIERDELQLLLDSHRPPVLLEALPEKHFHEGHLPGALPFPHDEVQTLAPQLLKDTGAAIVVYCASETCRNSHLAAEALERLGYRNVAVYAGGKKDWKAAGLPFEKLEDARQ